MIRNCLEIFRKNVQRYQREEQNDEIIETGKQQQIIERYMKHKNK